VRQTVSRFSYRFERQRSSSTPLPNYTSVAINLALRYHPIREMAECNKRPATQMTHRVQLILFNSFKSLGKAKHVSSEILAVRAEVLIGTRWLELIVSLDVRRRSDEI